jgi:hypothetical protein
MTRWRVGTKLGRTLYRDEVCVGMVDTPEIAAAIVAAMNREDERAQDAEPVGRVGSRPFQGSQPAPCKRCGGSGEDPEQSGDCGECNGSGKADVAALKEAGYEGVPYEQTRENVGTLIERATAAEARVRELEEVVGLLVLMNGHDHCVVRECAAVEDLRAVLANGGAK